MLAAGNVCYLKYIQIHLNAHINVCLMLEHRSPTVIFTQERTTEQANACRHRVHEAALRMAKGILLISKCVSYENVCQLYRMSKLFKALACAVTM